MYTAIETRILMNYQKIICWGDSQTYGARTYGCYPLYLAKILNEKTQYNWQAINFSNNGHTARDLWFRISHELLQIHDVYQACILIGTNDVGVNSSEHLFCEYYRQILSALQINQFHAVYCGVIPPIWPDAHAFFPAETKLRRERFNLLLRQVIEESPIARLVEFPTITADCYVDPVHFNEAGNHLIAESFANAIMNY
ncbi:MAG: SGNH/GDSL hydrolase family protein [Methylococcales bacterium]|nr:SGNH/GDSL hydrolase family protein [Methylococcales bacterium]MDD5631520.1 SGNH/GDSL hydrolase family protein [Methylococcales bacterium]